MCRDAANYKSFGKVELMGTFTKAHKSLIQDMLEDGTDFIPTEMDMKHVGQVELEDFGGEDDITEDMMTVDEFVKRLRDASANGWDVSAAMDELGIEL